MDVVGCSSVRSQFFILDPCDANPCDAGYTCQYYATLVNGKYYTCTGRHLVVQFTFFILDNKPLDLHWIHKL